MKVLVTGGAGYIGSVAVEQLVEVGESVVVFDNLYQGHQAAVHPDVIFVRGDLADRAAVDAALSQYRPEAIMHSGTNALLAGSDPRLSLRGSAIFQRRRGFRRAKRRSQPGATSHSDCAEIGARHPGDPAVLIAGSDKIRRELGRTPRYPDLHDIIESAWKWHEAYPRGYED